MTKLELNDTKHSVSDADISLYHESDRPQFHFTARQNWLNDPNGLVYSAGEYHLFFQHNPTANNWGNMTWGHAISTDLVTWHQMDNAIYPDHLGTIFSGSAVVDHNNTTGFQIGTKPPIVAVYTAAGSSSPESEGQPFTQCLAYSNDQGRSWTKYARNPVLPHIVGENRDPKVIWYAPGQFWVMALFLDGENFALFTSSNLKRWVRLQTLALPSSSECPDFFPMSVQGNSEVERWVFATANGHYLIGRFDGLEFTDITGPFAMDFGSNFYAVQTFSDIPASDGRRIQIGWMAGGIYPNMPFNQQMSFPAALTLRQTPQGLRVFRYPVAEISSLIERSSRWRDLSVEPGENPLAEITSDLLDISVEVRLEADTVFGFQVAGKEIRFSARSRELSCLGRTMRRESNSATVHLRILVDRASLEIFVDDGWASMSFCMTSFGREPFLTFFAEDIPVLVAALDVHTLRSAWRDASSIAT